MQVKHTTTGVTIECSEIERATLMNEIARVSAGLGGSIRYLQEMAFWFQTEHERMIDQSPY